MRFSLLLATALLAACGRCGQAPAGDHAKTAAAKPPAPAAPPTPGETPTAVPADRKASAAAAAADEARAAASTLLEAWKVAQNKGDAEAYFALYEPKEFKGLKRTHRGKVASFDFPAWRKDRGSMFKNAFEVAVEDPRIETWLDAESTLEPGVSSVRFLQRWRSKGYADHGPKSLLLWRDPRDGKTRLVFEELLLSRPGWDEPAREPSSLPAVAAAATVDEMTAALRGAGLDALSAGDVSLALDDPHARGLALKALAGMGSLDCLPEIMIGTGCGEEEPDWGQVHGPTPPPLDHPCTRREAVLALLSGAPPLPLDALQAAAEPLTAMLSKQVDDEDARDPELVGAVLQASEPLPEAERLPFLAAALAAPQWDELVAPRLATLSAKSLYVLWDDTKNPAALRPLALALDAHAARLAEIQSKAELPDDLILPIVPVLARQNRRDLLAQLSNDSNCALAMAAAAALAALGDDSKLPTWKAASDAEAGKRAICMLRHDPDRARAEVELRRFFHPTRKPRSASLSTTVNDFGELDEEGNRIEPPEPSAEEAQAIDEARTLVSAPDQGGVSEGSVETIDAPAPDLLIDARVFEPERDQNDYDVLELFEENGQVYLDYVGSYTYQWIGCPC